MCKSCVHVKFIIAITSLGEERASRGAFCTFVRFALVLFCLFPLPLGDWDGLRFAIVALSGLLPLFSSPEQRSRRAIVLSPASASTNVKFSLKFLRPHYFPILP